MTPDQERWAEALPVEQLHGRQAAAFVEARINALQAAGDAAGVARFREIGDRLAQLTRTRSALQSRTDRPS